MTYLPGMPVLVVDDNAVNRPDPRRDTRPVADAADTGRGRTRRPDRTAGTTNRPVPPFPSSCSTRRCPEMDGFCVAKSDQRAIRRWRGPPIMMLTSGRQGDGARCRELGVTAHLMKPVGERQPAGRHPDRPAARGPSIAERPKSRWSAGMPARKPANPAHPAGRGQQRQPAARRASARKTRPHRRRRRDRGEALAALDEPGSGGSIDPDGRADARHGRLRGHRNHPCTRANIGNPSTNHRDDRPRHEGR